MIDDLPWLDDEDIIISEEWYFTDEEVEGSTPDMAWMRNKRTRERALFKPDTFDGEEAWREYSVFKVAEYLGIACAKIQVGYINSVYGCLSYNCNNERRFRVADGYSLYRCDKLFNNKRSSTQGRVYDSPVDMSFRGLIPYLGQPTIVEVINMLFLDCIVKNADRHGGNYSFYINCHNAISGLMPLYDHGLCLRPDLRDISLMPYEGLSEIPFTDLFVKLHRDYSQHMNELLSKCLTPDFYSLIDKLGIYEFIQPRVVNFQKLTHNQLDCKIKKTNVFQKTSAIDF